MYSLYRAWFGNSVAADNYSRLQETLSPPDTVVRVGNEGEHQFVAHKGVLAAHSGYLKALLTSAAATPNQVVNANPTAVAAGSLSGQSTRQPVTSVSVSSIGGEAFAPLLNYMYTGRLEVTLDNVYSVLLATHLLHMPGALEQCRAALLRLRAPPPLPTPIPVPTGPTSTSTLTSTSMSTSTPVSGSILRPIPNRLMIDPSMCWPPTAPIYPPTAPASASIGLPHLPQLQPSMLLQSTVPHGVSVVPTSNVQGTQCTGTYSEVSSPKSTLFQLDRHHRGLRMDSGPKTTENLSSSALPFVAAAAFTAFAASNPATSARTPSPCQSLSPAPSSTSRSSLQHVQDQKPPPNDRSKEDPDCARQNNPVDQSTSSTRDRNIGNESTTTIAPENDRGGSSSKRRGRSSNQGNDDSTSVLSVVYDVACCDGPVKFHRVLNENYSSTASSSPSRAQRACFENASSENDENGGPRVVVTCESMDSGGGLDGGSSNGGSYACGYCSHTFKSQYCYRKHAKRHLLATRSSDSTSGNRQRLEANARSRREVRLLDLNVQYYPCKICGCKFPSYYFVHKHRKLCHGGAEERSQSDEGNSVATEDLESSSSTTNNERQ